MHLSFQLVSISRRFSFWGRIGVFVLALKRILSGMRPTGKLHLGNLHGALGNWVELQESGKYDCFYFVADWHAITSEYSSTEGIKDNTNRYGDRLAQCRP